MARGRKITPEIEREIVQRYIAGEGSPELADALGLCVATILSVVRRNGVAIRSHEEAAASEPCPTPEEIRERAAVERAKHFETMRQAKCRQAKPSPPRVYRFAQGRRGPGTI